MPVQRFRSFEEARRALWLKPGDPKLVETIRTVWAFSQFLVGDFPVVAGVRKFRNMEEANTDRKAWEKDRSKTLRARVRKER